MTLALVCIGAFLALALAAYLLGKKSEKENVAKKAANVAKKQTEIAVNAPKDKDELLDKLRNSGL